MKGFLVLGWIHDRNWEGLEWLSRQLNLQIHKIGSEEEIYQKDGTWLIFSCSSLLPNKRPDKMIISGPHLFWRQFPNSPIPSAVCNYLHPWVISCSQLNRSEWCSYIAAPFPIPYDKMVPGNLMKKSKAIIYSKNKRLDIVDKCVKETTKSCQHHNLDVVLFSYGSYAREIYLQTLKESSFVIFCIGTESQGFAVQEAMCLNVPIIMLDNKSLRENYENGPQEWEHPFYSETRETLLDLPATGATLWNSECGIQIDDTSQIESAVEIVLKNSYEPRKLILKEMNPEKCLERFLDPFV